MGEMRKHTSNWDSEYESEHLSEIREHNSWTRKDHHRSHGSACYQVFADSRTSFSQKSGDQSGWQSWESIEEHPIAPIDSSFKNTTVGKEINRERRYQNPFTDGGELHSYGHAHEYDRSPPQRSRGRDGNWSRSRSRGRDGNWSRSRSRARGRIQSRSLSRGRESERERVRVRGWSRNRRGGNANDIRSRSPIGHYRHQSNRRSDITSGCEESSQTCRYFTKGWCRRGRECRFFHPNSTSHGDDILVEDGTVESWRSRSDHSHMSKQRYSSSRFDSQIDVSNPYYREDEQFPYKSRRSVPCKDFMGGNCHWGEACRFAHHVAPADSFRQGTRNTSCNENSNHQVPKSGKPLCKYFAAGKCDKDNCRFSHEDANLNNQRGRKDKLTDNCSLHDKSSWCDAPKWNDAMRTYDTPKPTGWGESIVTNTASPGDTGNRQNSDRWLPWDHNFKTENNNYGIQERSINSSNEEKEPSLPRVSGSYAGNTGNRQSGDRWEPWDHNFKTESKKWGVQEVTISSLNCEKQSSLTGDSGAGYAGDTGNGQNNDGWEPWGNNFENENKKWGIQERTSNSLNDEKRPALPGKSGSYGGDMGPSASIAEDNIANKQEQSQGSQSQNQDNGVSNLLEQNWSQENQSFSVKALQQNVSHRVIENNLMNSFGSNESERVQNMLGTDSSNGIDTDMNGSEMHAVNPLNVQSNTQSTLRVVQSPEFLQAKVPQSSSDLLTSKHSNQVTNSQVATAGEELSPETNSVSFTLRLVKEQSQSSAGMNISDSRGMLHSFLGTTVKLPQVNTTYVQANPAAVSLDLLSSIENSVQVTEHDNRNLAHGMELNNQMQFPSSFVGTELDGSKSKPSESLRQQGEIVANIGVTKAMGEESKGIQENKPFETVNVQLKPEECSDNKAEKVMRVFKNALIEFVKEVLKPTWKDGRLSREAHRTVVKKVVDRVSSTIQVDQVPKTQDQIEQYLSYSKPKLTKLVQAYMERCQKPDA